ncbi:MAG: von Willebrand factor type A domain-containing protein [Acidobacteriota bacterium]
MRRLTKREIKAWLRKWSVPEPPEGLVEKIRKEIPEGLSPGIKRKDYLPMKARGIRLIWQVATCLVIFILGTAIGVLISQKFVTERLSIRQTPINQLTSKEPVIRQPVPDQNGVSHSEVQQRGLQKSESPGEALLQQAPQTEGFVQASVKPRSSFDLDIQPAAFDLVKDHIEKGKLPPSDLIRPEEIINHFNREDVPVEENDFYVRAEGASSPFTSDSSYKILKINMRNYLRAVAKDASVEIEFNPSVVDYYRMVGAEDREKGNGMDIVPRKRDIRANEALTAIYEVKLKPELLPEDPVATLKLEYSPASTEKEKVKKIHTIHFPLYVLPERKPSPDLEFAAMVAKYAQMLKEIQNVREEDFQSLLDRAKSLVRDIPQKNDLEEFIQLVKATEKLKKEARDEKAGLESTIQR